MICIPFYVWPLEILLTVLVTMKLVGYIQWPWWIVTIPFTVPCVVALAKAAASWIVWRKP